MRITDRAHIPLLMVALLPGLQRWECENGVVESLEVGRFHDVPILGQLSSQDFCDAVYFWKGIFSNQ